MSYPIYVKGAGEKAVAKSGESAGYSVVDEGDRAVLSGPNGKASFSNAGLTHFDVSEEETRVVIAHYGSQKEAYCCVTCNGWTYCGDSACCDMGGGNWLCC